MSVAATSAVLALFVIWYSRRAAYAGQAALVFIALDGLTKALLETLRSEPHFGLQIAAALASLVGFVVLFNRSQAGTQPIPGKSVVTR